LNVKRKAFSIAALALISGLARFDCAAADAPPSPSSAHELTLIDFSSPDAAKQVKPTKGVPASLVKVDKTGISMSFPIQPAPHTGVHVFSITGAPWDFSAYGHIEAKVANTGSTVLPMVMHVVTGSEGWWQEVNTEAVDIPPGQTRILTVYLGYQYGFEPSAEVHPNDVKELYLFLYDTNQPHSFCIEDLKAAGSASEKPAIDPNSVSEKPANGVILGPGATFNPSTQVEAQGAQVSPAADGALQANFTGAPGESLTIKPPAGLWDLSQANELVVKLKNVGSIALTPTIGLDPAEGSPQASLAPGAESTIVVPFTTTMPGTAPDAKQAGTKSYASNKTTGIHLTLGDTSGAKSLLITSIIADAATDNPPDWLGKRPPVDGDWLKTLDESFTKPGIDYGRWNIYAPVHVPGNFAWNVNHNPNRIAHFSKNEVIVQNGELLLRYEKSTGPNNDAPAEKKSNYASGFLSTYGKWTQRYGYYEARLKLPTASGLHVNFSLQPDRGIAAGAWAKRTALGAPAPDKNNSLAFDLLDSSAVWGPYRFTIAVHASPNPRGALASKTSYFHTDKDGYVTVGLLWTPGSAVFYVNGAQAYEWKDDRVSNVPSFLEFSLVRDSLEGGRLVDENLPDKLTISYVRAWQRKDLATPDDGPKPNKGDPNEMKN
jgi:beta-glucanase (GH16 family)